MIQLFFGLILGAFSGSLITAVLILESKFCDNYRAYRRQLEAMQAEKKKAEEGTRDYIGSFRKLHSRRR